MTMKLSTIIFFAGIVMPSPVIASQNLAEPQVNTCTAIEGITKCEVKCIREIGPQCLVTHINFEGNGLKQETELWRARFLTCRKADVDLQIKSLVLELEDIDSPTGPGTVSADVFSTSGKEETIPEKSTVIETGQTEGRVSRIPFKMFLDSGESHMEASLKLERCGASDGKNTCSISGKLVAVTNPNIRCEFHDTSLSGAFRKPSLQLSPSLQNSQQPVGRIGQ